MSVSRIRSQQTIWLNYPLKRAFQRHILCFLSRGSKPSDVVLRSRWRADPERAVSQVEGQPFHGRKWAKDRERAWLLFRCGALVSRPKPVSQKDSSGFK